MLKWLLYGSANPFQSPCCSQFCGQFCGSEKPPKPTGLRRPCCRLWQIRPAMMIFRNLKTWSDRDMDFPMDFSPFSYGFFPMDFSRFSLGFFPPGVFPVDFPHGFRSGFQWSWPAPGSLRAAQWGPPLLCRDLRYVQRPTIGKTMGKTMDNFWHDGKLYGTLLVSFRNMLKMMGKHEEYMRSIEILSIIPRQRLLWLQDLEERWPHRSSSSPQIQRLRGTNQEGLGCSTPNMSWVPCSCIKKLRSWGQKHFFGVRGGQDHQSKVLQVESKRALLGWY